jgi:hypothetical protein
MPFSTCCGAETDMTEIDICPECLEHCDWEEEDDEPSDEQIANNYRTEGGISFNNNSSWQGR